MVILYYVEKLLSFYIFLYASLPQMEEPLTLSCSTKKVRVVLATEKAHVWMEMSLKSMKHGSSVLLKEWPLSMAVTSPSQQRNAASLASPKEILLYLLSFLRL